MMELLFIYIGKEVGREPITGKKVQKGSFVEIGIEQSGVFLQNPENWELASMTIWKYKPGENEPQNQSGEN